MAMKKKPKKFDWSSIWHKRVECFTSCKCDIPEKLISRKASRKDLWLVFEDYVWKAVDVQGNVLFQHCNKKQVIKSSGKGGYKLVGQIGWDSRS